MKRIIERWNRGISDVLSRFDAILAEATAGSHAVIPRIELDLSPLTQPWTAVEREMHRHRDEVSDLWDRISDELSEVDRLPDGAMDAEGYKRDWATTEIEIRYTRAYRLAVAAAADVMRQRALLADARACSCRHCGALLDRGRLSGMALNIECGYCRAISTVEPGPALRVFASVGAMFLAEREALPLWEAMTGMLTQINQYRDRKDVPLQLLQEYEAAARGYWMRRFHVEAELVPEQRPFVQQKIDSYMKSVDKTLRQHWQWRQRMGR